MVRLFPAWFTAGLLMLATSLPALEPQNLALGKAEIIRYVESGEYQKDVTKVSREAIAFLEERAKRSAGGTGEKAPRLAIVFDLDETLLSNVSHMRAMDFGYVPAEWNRWVAEGAAPVVEPVREIYRTARKLGIAVLYLSGRRERDRPGTEKNLRGADVAEYVALVLKPNELQSSNAAFKTAAREKFEGEGWIIVANVGDQDSDLTGGHAERTFKVPGPFYLSP